MRKSYGLLGLEKEYTGSEWVNRTILDPAKRRFLFLPTSTRKSKFTLGDSHVKRKCVFTLLARLMVIFYVDRFFAVSLKIIFMYIPCENL